MKTYKDYLLRAQSVMLDARDALEQVLRDDDDLVLSSSTIGAETEMNLLQKKRQEIKQLENAVEKALAAKQMADAKLKAKEDAYKASQPVLPEGTIATFSMSKRVGPSMRPVQTNHGIVIVPAEDSATLLVQSGHGTLIEVSRDSSEMATMIEKEAAKMAHHEYVTLSQQLSNARVELRSFEFELTKLRDRIECLRDL